MALLIWTFLSGSWACSSAPAEKDIVRAPEKMDMRVSRDIRKLLQFAQTNKGRINDSVKLVQDSLTGSVYAGNEYRPFWCSEQAFLPAADSLFSFIRDCEYYGLFPNDYHLRSITGSRLQLTDSVTRTDAAAWSRVDLLLTDAFIQLSKHLQYGRLDRDSITLRKDTLMPSAYFDSLIARAAVTGGIGRVLSSLEPRLPQYDSLKAGLRQFLDSVRPFRRYTYVLYPNADTSEWQTQLKHRLFEEDILVSPTDTLNKEAWTAAITRYQEKAGLKKTGKLSRSLVDHLNTTDWEKFKRIAVNLDRYKQLPDTMPPTYLWVNIPGFYLELRDADSVVFYSRIVVGKPATRTPLLTGSITNMLTYPQWNIPTSIVVKEIIPGMRRDTNYLAKHGYVLINGDGQEVPPNTVNWWKYSKGLPYKVIQGSGDDNALGIMKFNFINKYSVYLHDTNQRYLFARTERALSHGCVRVQQWKKLAFYLLEQDSLSINSDREYNTDDSVKAWLTRKEKHWVPVRSKMPLFIRYFTCDGRNGRVKFYDDIYEEDQALVDAYFADKPVQ